MGSKESKPMSPAPDLGRVAPSRSCVCKTPPQSMAEAMSALRKCEVRNQIEKMKHRRLTDESYRTLDCIDLMLDDNKHMTESEKDEIMTKIRCLPVDTPWSELS